jgi:iron(III) transport system permease protein
MAAVPRRPGTGAGLRGCAAAAVAHCCPELRRGLLSLGYAVPGAVIAVGILLPLGWLQARWPDAGVATLVTGTLFGLVLSAYLVRFSAGGAAVGRGRLCARAASVDETARMLGARPRRDARRAACAAAAPVGLAAAMLLVFVDVMKELPATLVLRPFGSDTLAVVAYNLARDERLGEAALPSLRRSCWSGLMPVLLLSRALRAVEASVTAMRLWAL